MLRIVWLAPVAIGLLGLMPASAMAASPDLTAQVVPAIEGEAPQIDAGPSVPVSAEAPVERSALDDAELAELRGGQTIVMANQTMEAIAAGNTIGGDVTAGAVSLADSALSNFNGLGNIIINTGSQVNLLSGMNLTININP